MGAPLNTLAGALVLAFVIYAAKRGLLSSLTQIVGLGGDGVGSPPSTTSKDPGKVIDFSKFQKTPAGGKK